jgi:hypothetical protein
MYKHNIKDPELRKKMMNNFYGSGDTDDNHNLRSAQENYRHHANNLNYSSPKKKTDIPKYVEFSGKHNPVNEFSSFSDPSDEFIEYNEKINDNKTYADFMKTTLAPQRNPYGEAGNKASMGYYNTQGTARAPTDNNPFMNVPIEDYDKQNIHGKAEPNCGKACQDSFYKRLFRSPDDALWNRQASERQFYTMPVTTVPNEQIKFAEWLYGNNYVGKSGSIYDRYGYPYTPDSMVNTGANAASPQNGGQMETNAGTPYTVGASPYTSNLNYGYGFGGIPGGVPMMGYGQPYSPMMSTNPYPLVPVYPMYQYPGFNYQQNNSSQYNPNR